MVAAAGAAEAAHWATDGEVTLRGRSRPTRIAVPARVREPVPSSYRGA
jgi:adenylate cyclase